MRLKSDLLTIIEACIDGRLSEIQLEWREENAVCVVMASKGYPGAYEKGQHINIPDQLKNKDNLYVFHAGTSRINGNITASGGRVLGVTALGNTLKAAVDEAYSAIEKIDFKNAHFRKDIAYRALA